MATVLNLHSRWNSCPPQPPGSPILVSWPCLKGYFPIIPAIQTCLCYRFRLAVEFLGQLERDVPAMADNVGADLDQFLAQCGSPQGQR